MKRGLWRMLPLPLLIEGRHFTQPDASWRYKSKMFRLPPLFLLLPSSPVYRKATSWVPVFRIRLSWFSTAVAAAHTGPRSERGHPFPRRHRSCLFVSAAASCRSCLVLSCLHLPFCSCAHHVAHPPRPVPPSIVSLSYLALAPVVVLPAQTRQRFRTTPPTPARCWWTSW